MNTCDGCAHYAPGDPDGRFKFAGTCRLIEDRSFPRDEDSECSEVGVDVWTDVPVSQGLYVGPKFGCIHWLSNKA